MAIERQIVELDGRRYQLDVQRCASVDPAVPRLIIPAYQPTPAARHILEICIDTIQKITPLGSYELWVVDNCSPRANTDWLFARDGVNVALSRTKPLPPEGRTLFESLAFWRGQERWGSYANAVGIELCLYLIDPDVKRLMTLHMDTMPCSPHWLEYLSSKLDDKTKASGVCMERHRTKDGIVHILGCMVDLRAVSALGLKYWPDLPDYDVGDKVTIGLREGGYQVYACKNTYEDASLAELIDLDEPLRQLQVVRSFDDQNRPIFLHLGRGIPKAGQKYVGESASLAEWSDFASKHILSK